MQATTFSRKLDSMGRIIIPIRLREQMGLKNGIEYPFFIHEQDGHRYICIECPGSDAKIEEAFMVLKQAGYDVS